MPCLKACNEIVFWFLVYVAVFGCLVNVATLWFLVDICIYIVYGFIANVGVFGFLVNVAVVVLPALLAPPTLRLPLLEIQNTR